MLVESRYSMVFKMKIISSAIYRTMNIGFLQRIRAAYQDNPLDDSQGFVRESLRLAVDRLCELVWETPLAREHAEMQSAERGDPAAGDRP